MQANKLNIGILGCGPIAQFAHLEACQKAHNVILYAVCDIAEDLATKLGSFYDAKKIYTDFDLMLADPHIDAIIIATSDTFHLPASIKAIQAGKHVLVEKPLGDDLILAHQLKLLIARSGLIFQIGHMKRFDKGVQCAKSFIKEGLGELIAIKSWYCDATHRYDMTDSTQPVPIKSTQSIKPKENPKSDLKKYYMMAHGSHLVDLTRFLAGPIKSVRARLVEKQGMFNWFIDTSFENGCNGHMDLTVAVRMDWHEGFHIYGTEGSILGKIYNPWYFKVADVQCFSEKDQQYHQLLDNKAHFFQLQLESFAETILHGTPQYGADINDGIASIQAMIAIADAVRSGQEILLSSVKGQLV